MTIEYETGLFISGSRSEDGTTPEVDTFVKLRQGLEAAGDLSVNSGEMRTLTVDWVSEYFLSAKRTHIFYGLEIGPGQRWLDYGGGAGISARYLGEHGCNVLVFEPDGPLAELARLRCRDLPGVSVATDLAELVDAQRGFDGILLVDTATRWPLAATVQRLKTVTSPESLVVIAEQNPMGMKYLYGCGADYFPQPDHGDSPRLQPESPYHALNALRQSGFNQTRLYYPFPDHRLPRSILSDAYLRSDEFAASRLDGIVSRDYQARLEFPGEYGFWRRAHQNGELGRLSNSFIIHGRSESEPPDLYDFVYFGGENRKLSFQAITEMARDSKTVCKIPRYADLVDVVPADHKLVSHRFGSEPFVSGETLGREWMASLTESGSLHALKDHAREYYEWLCDRCKDRPGDIYDLVTSNIVRNNNAQLVPIDLEWRCNRSLSAQFVLFRGLLFFFRDFNRDLETYCRQENLFRIVDFISWMFDVVDLDVFTEIDEFINLEDEIQKEIQPSYLTINTRAEAFTGIGYGKFTPRLFWSCSGEDCTVENSMAVHAAIGWDRQELEFLLPEHVKQIQTVRFDPVHQPGFFRLYRLDIQGYMGGVWKNLLSAGSESEVVKLSSMRDVQYARGVSGKGFLALNENPVLEWLVDAGKQSGITRVRVVIEMSSMKSSEFAIFENRYLRKEQQYVRELSQLAIMKGQLIVSRRNEKKFKKELETIVKTIEQSKVWRIVTRLRHLFYVELLGRVPGLQSFFLDLTRLGAKRALANLFSRGETPAAFDPLERIITGQSYEEYQERTKIDDKQRHKIVDEIGNFAWRPKISILMPVYNATRSWLMEAVSSVENQIYGNWELCITDDASTSRETIAYLKTINNPKIKVRYLKENKNISGATNTSFESSDGEYIAFMDNDDVLAENALFAVAKKIDTQDPDIIYSDEDFIDPTGKRINPHFKNDYSPDLLLSHNYITHFCVVRRFLFEKSGGLRSEFDGAQDYDFLLRATELTDKICHIPKILYHWRMSSGSTSFNSEAKPAALKRGRLALTEALRRRNIEGSVLNGNASHFFRVRRKISGAPLVSIVIPFKDQPRLLEGCLESILSRSTYTNFEIVGVNNNSEMEDTWRLMQEYEKQYDNIRFVDYDRPFNFSAVVNRGFQFCNGEHIVLMNNDVEVISWDWIETLLEHSQRKEVGIVGGKLYYEGDTVQHAGIVIGVGGYAGHVNKHMPCQAIGYFNRTHVIQNISAVTGAYMMVKRSVWQALDGFNEVDFKVACNDVDFCLRARELGLLNIFTPYSQAYHYESVSRGYEDNPEKKARFEREKTVFRKRHAKVLRAGDPYFNINFSRDHENFVVRVD